MILMAIRNRNDSYLCNVYCYDYFALPFNCILPLTVRKDCLACGKRPTCRFLLSSRAINIVLSRWPNDRRPGRSLRGGWLYRSRVQPPPGARKAHSSNVYNANLQCKNSYLIIQINVTYLMHSDSA